MNKYFAELVGTFVLVFGGVGSAVLAGSHIGFAGIAAAFGLSLLAMVYTIGPISGCHVNPAVTLGVFLARKINARDAAAYMVAQVIGAVIASAVILFIANGLPGGYSASVSGLGRTATACILRITTQWLPALLLRPCSPCFSSSPFWDRRTSALRLALPAWPSAWC